MNPITFGKVYRFPAAATPSDDRMKEAEDYALVKSRAGTPAALGRAQFGQPYPEPVVYTNEGDNALGLFQSISRTLHEVWKGKRELSEQENATLGEQMKQLKALEQQAELIEL